MDYLPINHDKSKLLFFFRKESSKFDSMLLSCHVRASEWIYTLNYLNVKELLARNRCDIWSLSVSNETGTHNHLLCKQTLNHLDKSFSHYTPGSWWSSLCCQVNLFIQHLKENSWMKNSLTYISQNLSIFQHIISNLFSLHRNYAEYICNCVACRKNRKNTKEKCVM